MKKDAGFTLIEILVVIGIMAVAAAVIIPSLLASRNSHALSDGQMTVMEALESARGKAMAGASTTVLGGNQGVLFNGSTMTFFEATGTTYNTSGVGNYSVNVLSTPLTTNLNNVSIIFMRITGTSTASTSIVITNPNTGAKASTSVNFQGTIYPN